MALIPPFFLDCVVAVGFPGPDGKPRFAATGFLYGRFIRQTGPDEKLYWVFLVTNRHVVQNRQLVHLRFNPQDDTPARVYDAPLLEKDGKPLWFGHPDPDVDVAILRINVRLLDEQKIRFGFFKSDESVLSKGRAVERGLSEGDGVFVLGFPLGAVGEHRNFVIVRQGVVARVRDALAGHTNEFLVDANIFPGNSGGPVVLRPEALAIQGTRSIPTALLLGVVAGYVPYKDIAVSTQTNNVRVIFEENSGLAAVYPIDFVEQTIDTLPAEDIAAAASSPQGGAPA